MYETIKKDLLEAMKSGDKFKLGVIRMLKSALQNEEISNGGLNSGLTDDQVLTVIKREVKKRNSSIEEYEKYGKDEMVKTLKQEVEILQLYLPEELSEEALEKIVEDTISELGASTMKDMGNVIKTISSKYASQADMSKVSKIVKEKLQ